MTIVMGRGNKRQTIELPTGSLVALAAKHDPEAHKAGIQTLCGLLNIKYTSQR